MSLPTVSKETLGTFVDAVYAIAMTILALEIPAELDEAAELAQFTNLLLDYALSFIVLFALWMQHRRILTHARVESHSLVWLHGLVLLMVCLIPRATTLVFSYGGDVVLSQLHESLWQGEWTRAEIVDLFYVALVAFADLLLLLLARLTLRAGDVVAGQVWRAKRAMSIAVFTVLGVSFLLPIENRLVLLILPLVLLAEHRLAVSPLAD